MASTAQQVRRAPVERRRRDAEGARTALVEAAAQLLTERAPNSITGRDIAARAGVNYGLLHHYFGGRDGALSAGIEWLRASFTAEHGDGAFLRFLGAEGHPYLKAIVRSQVDYPNSVRAGDGFPIGHAIAAAISARGDGSNPPAPVSAEAKARAIAAITLQVCYGVFGPALLDATGVRADEVPTVEQHLTSLYDHLVLTKGDPT
jgi:TetR/AcrR family transcriptional regulator, repressor for neighboring sulfatase